MSGAVVAELIRRGAAAPPYISPVDAVMGEDWAHIKLGDPRQLLQLQHLVRRAAERTAQRKISLSAEIAYRSPEAMVKLVRKGGACDAAGLRAQMAYLSREGTIPLHRSERYFGLELDAASHEDLVGAWGFGEAMAGRVDRTSHFVVSFPAGTPADAAERAGRAWAEAMFASRRFGDCWDYYTAFHTDRAHPHIHVVVHRRGLEAGEWLKVSKRSPITFDVLREIQVEVARRHGIDLVATPRLARGVHDRPAPDAAYRRAGRDGRGVDTPAHTPATAVQAAAAVLFYARRLQGDADLVERDHHPVAAALRAAAALLQQGLQLDANGQGGLSDDTGEIERVSDLIEGKRGEVISLFTRIDREIAEMGESAERVSMERSAAELKAQAAALLPDREDLQAYRVPPTGRYAGIVAIDAYGRQIKTRADAEVLKAMDESGTSGPVTVARYGGAAVPPVLAEAWNREELADLARGHGVTRPLTAEDIAVFQPIIDARHERIAAIYRHAAEDMVVHEARKDELRGLTPEEIDRDPRRFARLIRNTLTEQQRQQLEAGMIDALADITDHIGEQVRLARGYLTAVQREATTAGERERAAEALRALDRLDEAASEERRTARRVERDDGHSL